MKTTEFETIKTVLTSYIKQATEVVETCTVDGQIEFTHLTVGQINNLAESARILQSKTDQFLKQDLYHIIGMGNLSAVQSAVLNKLVREVTNHRSIVKAVAALPRVPSRMSKTVSMYKASTVGLQLTKQRMQTHYGGKQI